MRMNEIRELAELKNKIKEMETIEKMKTIRDDETEIIMTQEKFTYTDNTNYKNKEEEEQEQRKFEAWMDKKRQQQIQKIQERPIN